MRTFLATTLGVIAVGVTLIAYALLGPRTAAAPYAPYGPYSPYGMTGAQPAPNGDVVSLDPCAAYRTQAGYVVNPVVYPANEVRAVRTVQSYTAPARRVAEPRIERAPRRDWGKTALVIGGSTAGGAGIGGLIGGKKGALIGAALGGGASTLWEALKR